MQQIITTKKMLAETMENESSTAKSCNDLLRFNSLSLAAKVVFSKVAQLQNCFLYRQKFEKFQNSVYGKTMHSYGGGQNACKSMARCISYGALTGH
ncbi:hypothetical protein TYRP_019272 [Tyrophagus putrescentiae]|nr:hypothetical protein TYRP_019272 [Tyrophagus putrescentiae]